MRVTSRPAVRAVALTLASAILAAALFSGLWIDAAVAAPPAAVVGQATPDGPKPVGQTLPSSTQRGADMVIAVLLLVTLAGTLVAVATTSRWNHRH